MLRAQRLGGEAFLPIQVLPPHDLQQITGQGGDMFFRQGQLEMLVDCSQRNGTINQKPTGCQLAEINLLDIVLIVNFTDNLFYDIFESHDPFDTTT